MTKSILIVCAISLLFYSCKDKCDDQNSHNYKERNDCETCYDGIINGDETKTDCGGALCLVPCIKLTKWITASSDIPDNTIRDISQTTDGSIWLATGFGISKFDGTNFSNWNETNSDIQSNAIYAIQGYGNKVYVGTINDGLSLFDGVNWTSFSSNSNVNYSINCMAANSDRVFVGTTFRGISIFEDTVYVQTYNKDNCDIPGNNILDIEFDDSNNMWVSTDQGVVRFDGSSWTIFNSTNSGISDNYVSHLEIDQNNRPWITTQNGIQRYDGTSWVVVNSELTNSPALGFHEVDETIWVINGLINRYPNPYNGSFFCYPDDNFSGLCIISIGSYLWVGSEYDGLCRIEYL